MDRQAYKSFHEQFVSNNKGTTLLEVNLISLICPLSVLLIAKLKNVFKSEPEVLIDDEEDEVFFGETPHKKDNVWQFLLEFVIVAVPLWIVFTDLFPSTLAVLIFAILALSFSSSKNHSKLLSINTDGKLAFLTNYRASMLLVTAICILGVDFKVFPRRFAKTEELGFGVMDIGVGSFVFSAGTVAPSNKSKLIANCKRSLILVILGILKYFSTAMVDYHSHVSEYGIHWNFFITMGIVQFVCGTVTCHFPKNYVKTLGVTLAIIHEVLLYKYHYKWIFAFSPKARFNSNFVLANIEGIVSLIGFSSIFMMGVTTKGLIYEKLKYKSQLIRAGKCLNQN